MIINSVRIFLGTTPMTKTITSKPRPKLPYEHPNIKIYKKLFKENIISKFVKKTAYNRNDIVIIEDFSNGHITLKELCENLVSYIAEAFSHYSVWDYTHAYYPGSPGQQTVRTDALEGVSRVLPILAARLHCTDCLDSNGAIYTRNGQLLFLTSIIKNAFINGTNPQHKGFWGNLENYDQKVCESADLALTLWLSRKWVWDTLDVTMKKQIIAWFKQVNHCEIVDNNWHLFPLTVQFVIKALTGEDTIAYWRYERIKEFYVGNGWFRDGAKGNYDYYNAWGFYYSLYWLNQIIPDFEAEFIRDSLDKFNKSYLNFITPTGFVFFGRSACYRLAVSAPLLAGISLGGNSVKIGEAKRALETTLRYFITNGALKNGVPTQGLFNHDTRLVDNYSGPASSFWSLRAVIIALYCAEQTRLWDTPELPLPIEKSDFSFDIPEIKASVVGIKATQEVVVIFRDEYIQGQSPLNRRLNKQNWYEKLLENITGQSRRPKNNLLRKGITCYSSKMSHFF